MQLLGVIYEQGLSDSIKPYYSYFYRLLMPSLDAKGTAVKEYLFRKKRHREPSTYFKNFSDADLNLVLQELQGLALKVTYGEILTLEESAIHAAFRRTVRKLRRMGHSIV